MLDKGRASSPLITVVVPAYNYGRYIAETIKSVQAQSYENWECLVVDDGSTDDTAAVVAQIADADSRVKYIKQQNLGLAAARNTGIKNASGEYFQFLDADDLLEPNKLEQHVAFLKANPEIDIVFSDARYFRNGHSEERFYNPDGSSTPWVAKLSAKGPDVLVSLVRNNIMVVSSPLLRKSAVDDVGLFEASTKGIEDWHYWVRCAVKGKHFHYDDSSGTHTLVRVHGSSMSTDARMMLRSTLLLHRKVAEMVTDSAVLRINRERMIEREGLLGIEELAAGKQIAGILQLCKAAILDRRLRAKAKWLLCAASAPFVSMERLKGMVTSSVTRSVVVDLKKTGTK
jgi:glycosyltransferase involved in cell wall biosynthesis